MRILILALAILAAGIAGCNAPEKKTLAPPPVPPATAEEKTEAIAKFREYTIWVNTTNPDNVESIKRLVELGNALKEQQLPLVVQWAQTPPGRPLALGWARLLVERGKFDDAALVIIDCFAHDQVRRAKGMWKWWKDNFEGRPNSKEMGRNIVDAILRVYDTVPQQWRYIVLDIFNQPPENVRLSGAELRKKIPTINW